MTSDTFIAVEWGTVRINARLLTANGEVVDQALEDVRLVDLDHPAKVARVQQFRARWADASETLWLAGMIGSPLGLETVTQLPCPATAGQLARHARQTVIGGCPTMILPGLSCTSRFGDHDVMRGEEVAAAGLIRLGASGDAVLLSVPGMHGKWIELSQSRIERFHTSMTAELYHVIAERSILAPLMKAAPSDGEPFRLGLTLAAQGGAPARLLFSARSSVLAKRFSEEDAASYIWGVLIGSDVRENLPGASDENRPFFVTGAEDVARFFHAALTHFGVKADLVENGRLSAVGFANIRQSMIEGDHDR